MRQLLAGLVIAVSSAGAQDTTFVEVGSPALDGRVFKPHAARVRVYRGDSLVADWINELTLGDSAGRRVMRWVTTGNPVPLVPARPLSVLRQTYDAITLAPLGYSSTSTSGAFTHVAVDGNRVRGSRRGPADTVTQPVDHAIDRPGFFAGASDLVPVAAGLKVGSVIVAPVWSPQIRTADYRVFRVLGDTTIDVEGTKVNARRVDEFRRDTRARTASWFLLLDAPYMVYGEVPLPDGRVQRMTEVPWKR